jgi:hypothetical protein
VLLCPQNAGGRLLLPAPKSGTEALPVLHAQEPGGDASHRSGSRRSGTGVDTVPRPGIGPARRTRAPPFQPWLQNSSAHLSGSPPAESALHLDDLIDSRRSVFLIHFSAV